MVKSFRKRLDKFAKNRLLLWVIFSLQWLIFLSCFKRFNGEQIDKKPYVILFWHGRLALMPFIFRKFRRDDKKAFVMISRHKDGELITNLIALFGINAVRGSSSRGGSLALKHALEVLDQKHDLAITPDGPRGPLHSIADGPVLLAQKKGVEIRIANYEASRFWQFKSWDEMILPKPFSRLNFSLSKPFNIANLDKQEAKSLILAKFNEISKMDAFKD